MKRSSITSLDLRIIAWLSKWFQPVARVAIFTIFFYFGLLKLLDLSPASPIALALVDKTVGAQYFEQLFIVLALLECLIGLLFLVPRATRVVVPLLLLHMITVCSPLLLVPNEVWSQPFVPSLEGQYIIKNVVIIAVAIGIAAQTKPLKKKS